MLKLGRLARIVLFALTATGAWGQDFCFPRDKNDAQQQLDLIDLRTWLGLRTSDTALIFRRICYWSTTKRIALLRASGGRWRAEVWDIVLTDRQSQGVKKRRRRVYSTTPQAAQMVLCTWSDRKLFTQLRDSLNIDYRLEADGSRLWRLNSSDGCGEELALFAANKFISTQLTYSKDFVEFIGPANYVMFAECVRVLDQVIHSAAARR